jgi:putative transposase
MGGYLFQGRYKAIVVDPEARDYLVALSDYIHLNPVRAGVVGKESKLFSYIWSSYPAYVKGAGAARQCWLKTGTVLGELGLSDCGVDRRRYAERMKARAMEGLPEELKNQGWCLGARRSKNGCWRCWTKLVA